MIDAIVQLTPEGSYQRKLVYVPKYVADEASMEKGWYDADDLDQGIYDNPYNDVAMPFGSAVQIAVDGSNAKVNFAGEVKKTETISPVAGVMSIANCACKRLYIKDVKTNCSDETESLIGWQAMIDAIVQLTPEGSYQRKLVYVPKYVADEASMEKGWYDADDLDQGIYDNPYNEKTYWDAGFGFQVAVDGANALIQIDPAITDDAE